MKRRRGSSRRKAQTPWLSAIRDVKVRNISALVLERDPVPDALKRLVKILGNNQVADILGVARSQASRWLHGEPIGPESARRILDFDHVLRRALRVLHPDEVGAFLTFPQPFLNGARPIDVLVTRGVGPVISALDQIDEGAFV